MRALKGYLKTKGIRRIYLSYFGTADPNSYGITHAAVGPLTIPNFKDAEVDLRMEKQALFVISATNYQHTYLKDTSIFDWLHRMTPSM